MKRKLNLGIVGFGYIGKYHYEAIEKLSDKFVIKTIFDNNLSFKEKKKIGTKAKIIKNFTLKKIPNNLDIIVITSPTYLHIKFGEIAIKKSNMVIIEKPLGLNSLNAKKLINNSIKENKKIIVVKQLRLNPYFLLVKEMIQKNMLGKIYFFGVDIFLNRSKKYYSSSKWKGRKKFDGGTLYNQISHFIDLLYWFFAEPKKSYGTKLFDNLKNNEHSGQISLIMKDNTFASVNYSIKCYEKNLNTKFTIISENATLEVFLDKILVQSSNKNVEIFLKKQSRKTKNEANKFGKGFGKFYEQIYKTYFTSKPFNPSISINEDALKSFMNLKNINKKMRVIYND